MDHAADDGRAAVAHAGTPCGHPREMVTDRVGNLWCDACQAYVVPPPARPRGGLWQLVKAWLWRLAA